MTGDADTSDATVGTDEATVVRALPPADPIADLIAAAGSSTGFWDHPMDDEDWNAS